MGQHRGANRQKIVVTDGTIGAIANNAQVSDELPPERENQDHHESEESREKKQRSSVL